MTSSASCEAIIGHYLVGDSQLFRRKAGVSAEARLNTIGQSHLLIELSLTGTVLSVNTTCLDAFGYEMSEIVGQHHSMLVSSETRSTAEYRAFLANLTSGQSQTGEFKYIAKDGHEVWVDARYSPVHDENGAIICTLACAIDITQRKLRNFAERSEIAAIGRAMAVIEFDLDGTIRTANENFLCALGYSLIEIQGKHHSIFVAPAERESDAYRNLWAALNRGEYRSSEYKRIGKDGREVWILASYNPLVDEAGRPCGVVKFATDITAQKKADADLAGQIEAIGKSQAVIEFNMDGTIVTANKNFLTAMGYALDEIRGKHHSLFVEPSERNSADYQEFWARLNSGQYQAAEFKRFGKNDKAVYIQASYNPILDANGKPFKVVKYATDITDQVMVRLGNERVRSMMESVAAGAEELNASVREISEAMTKSRDTATGAADRVATADSQAQRLTDAAQSMSGIVDLINKITGQINLLALNATIESARAGEAGRGFAVVASEVKNLANQAKQATDKIGDEIAGLNEISAEVVATLVEIKKAINNVSEYVTSTAAAVEEQSIVTNEMSTSIQRAATEAAKMVSI